MDFSIKAACEGNFFSTQKSRDCVITAANKVGDVFMKALTMCENQIPAIDSFTRRVTTVKPTEDAQKALRDEIIKAGDKFSEEYAAVLEGESPYKIGQVVYDAVSKNRADLKKPEVAGAYNDAIMRFRSGDVRKSLEQVMKKLMSTNDHIRDLEDKLSGVSDERIKTIDIVRSYYIFVQRRVNNLESAIDSLSRG